VRQVHANAAEMSKPKGAMGSGDAAAGHAKSNQFWWPGQLDLSPLRDHDVRSNPMGDNFNYAEAFGKLDLEAVKQNI
jgi:catalase-peroxidase